MSRRKNSTFKNLFKNRYYIRLSHINITRTEKTLNQQGRFGSNLRLLPWSRGHKNAFPNIAILQIAFPRKRRKNFAHLRCHREDRKRLCVCIWSLNTHTQAQTRSDTQTRPGAPQNCIFTCVNVQRGQ